MLCCVVLFCACACVGVGAVVVLRVVVLLSCVVVLCAYEGEISELAVWDSVCQLWRAVSPGRRRLVGALPPDSSTSSHDPSTRPSLQQPAAVDTATVKHLLVNVEVALSEAGAGYSEKVKPVIARVQVIEQRRLSSGPPVPTAQWPTPAEGFRCKCCRREFCRTCNPVPVGQNASPCLELSRAGRTSTC